MSERHVRIGSAVDRHARPASLFVHAASRQSLRVTIAKVDAERGAAVDARSILSVLGLDARNGDEVVLTAHWDGDEGVRAELAAPLGRDLDAEG